jgi:hypothetical protein
LLSPAGLVTIAPGTPVGTKALFIDPCAFGAPALGYNGNVARNPIYGPNFSNMNFSVVKDTKLKMLGESGSMQFRAEFFNVLNKVSWNSPNGTLFTFTQAQSTVNTFAAAPISNTIPNQITSTASKPREIQFALKVLF